MYIGLSYWEIDFKNSTFSQFRAKINRILSLLLGKRKFRVESINATLYRYLALGRSSWQRIMRFRPQKCDFRWSFFRFFASRAYWHAETFWRRKKRPRNQVFAIGIVLKIASKTIVSWRNCIRAHHKKWTLFRWKDYFLWIRYIENRSAMVKLNKGKNETCILLALLLGEISSISLCSMIALLLGFMKSKSSVLGTLIRKP